MNETEDLLEGYYVTLRVDGRGSVIDLVVRGISNSGVSGAFGMNV